MIGSADPRYADYVAFLAETNIHERPRLHETANILAAQQTTDETFSKPRASSLLSQRTDSLADMVRDGVPPPRFLPSKTFGEELFYSFGSFLFSGHKKAGKSWGMILLSGDVMEAGRPVVYIDNENGAELVAERLSLAGIAEALVRERFHYLAFPTLPSLDDLREELEAMAREVPEALVIVDSLRSFMAKYGLDPNRDVDVEAFLGVLMAVAKTTTLTFGVIDHANRSTRRGDLYAAGGSQAKSAAVDAVYYFDKATPYSQDVEGIVSISVVDDRRGRLDFERHYKIGGQGPGKPLHFAPTEAKYVGAYGQILGNLWQFLADTDGDTHTLTDLRNAANTGKGAATSKDEAIAQLVGDPDVPVYEIPGKTDKAKPRYGCDIDRWERERGAAFTTEAMSF